MSRRRCLRFTLILLSAGIVATIAKAGWNWFEQGARKSFGDPCSSADEARHFGTLVSLIEFEPNTIVVNGRHVGFREGWIEEESDPSHRLIWIPTRKRLGGFNLVLIPDTSERDESQSEPRLRVQLVQGDSTLDKQAGNSMKQVSSSGRVLYFVTLLDSVDRLPDRAMLLSESPGDSSFREVGLIRLRFKTP
jgi:hypothetical protein